MPGEEMVATEMLELVHVPPLLVSVSEIMEPVHTEPGPVIGAGDTFTVTAAVVKHPVGSEYDMTAVPGEIPVTMPVLKPIISIVGLLLLHIPPAVISLSVVDAPGHIVVLPVIVAGTGFTVIPDELLQPVGSV